MKQVIIVATIVLSAIALIFGSYGYPVRAINDAAAYLVPGIQMALTGKLENPILWTGHAQHSGPFVNHMPLFQILFHFLISPERSTPLPLQLFMIIGIINAAVIALSARGLYRLATAQGRKLDWPTVILICIALVMILRASWSFGGRDETFVRLLFTVGFLFALNMRRSIYLAGVLGVILGAIAATSTFAFVFFAVFIGLVFALKYDHERSLLDTIGTPISLLVPPGSIWRTVIAVGDWRSVRNAAVAGAVGIISFVVIMQISPYSIATVFRGTLALASATAEDTLSVRKNLFAIFKSAYVFLYAVIGLSFAFFAMRIYPRILHARRIASPLLILLSALAAACYVAFVVINGFRLYYIAPFLLLLFAAMLMYITRAEAARFAKYALIFPFALLVLLSLGHLLLFPSFLKDGMMLSAARDEFEKVISQYPGSRVTLGGSRMWALSEDYARMVLGDVPEGTGKYLFVREEEENPELLSQFDSCKLIESFYRQKKASLWGISLGRHAPGYGFALYECQP